MKRIFSILLVAIMLFSTLAIGTQAQEVTTEAPNANGMVDFITFPSITITIDYYEQTVTLS